MRQIGTIKSVQGQTAVVQVVRQGSCGDNCSMCGMCANRVMDVTAKCSIAVTNGDKVWLESDSKAVLGAMALVFFLPVALPLIAFVLGQVAWGIPSGGVLAGVVFAATVAAIVLLGRNNSLLTKTQASVVAKVEDNT